MSSEDGGVLTLAAIVLPILLLVSAGGVAGFTLYGSHRELQRAADQAALAGAAALPPFDPNVLVENAPFPLPDTDPAYTLLEGATGENLPRMGDLVPDPRAVACAIGSGALSSSESATLVTAFGDDFADAPSDTVCTDTRVRPVIEPDPVSTTPIECTNRLVEQVAGDLSLSSIQGAVNAIVQMPLDHVLPAAFTPRMRVTASSGLRPPLVSLITGEESGTLRSFGIAHRRIKNAVVVPILPAQRLLIDLGLVDPIDVMTDPVNLNEALHTAQAPLIDAIADADDRLDSLMGTFGLSCRHLLHNLRLDLRDLYDPPTGPAASARDVVDAAVTAAEQTADRIGESEPDPTDPDSLAGEAFVLVGITVDELLGPVSSTLVPILDVALVSMQRAADGDFRASVISAANAHGAFRAVLVE